MLNVKPLIFNNKKEVKEMLNVKTLIFNNKKEVKEMLNVKTLIFNNKKGFTLIELMIVVAIIAILAAIAIPNFLNYRMKARTAEAKSNIGSINTLEEAYAADANSYVTAGWSGAITSSSGTASWTSGSYIEGIGFKPKGTVYYVYSVGTTAPSGKTLTVGTDGTASATDGTANIYIMATADLDGDASDAEGGTLNGNFSANDEDRTISDVNPGEF